MCWLCWLCVGCVGCLFVGFVFVSECLLNDIMDKLGYL